ncbi:hypothetical protein [Consotaella salsifontis]|nr:hypothetical protein [Consotaella salsifontis]
MEDEEWLDEIQKSVDASLAKWRRETPDANKVMSAYATYGYVMEMFATFTEITKRNNQDYRARMEALNHRISELEQGGVKFCGVHQRALAYRKGSAVTSDGSLWIALRDASEGEQPGKAPEAWQLAAKGARQ